MSWLDDILHEVTPTPYPNQNMGLLPDESSEKDDLRYDANTDAAMKRDEAKERITGMLLNLIEQSKDKSLPLTWLAGEINKL